MLNVAKTVIGIISLGLVVVMYVYVHLRRKDRGGRGIGCIHNYCNRPIISLALTLQTSAPLSHSRFLAWRMGRDAHHGVFALHVRSSLLAARLQLVATYIGG
jgi:hypothetical protein